MAANNIVFNGENRTIMLTYNPKFTAELKKGKSDPATLVYLQDSIFFDEKTLQADWTGNIEENNVDYTPSPPQTGDVELLLPDTWDSGLTDAQDGRFDHTAVEYNGKMYIFGGFTTGYTNDVREYDIIGDSWAIKTSGATIRREHTAIEYNGKMYIFGGYPGFLPRLNDVWEYDILGNSWTQLTSGATIRSQHIAVEYNGKMYIYGGQNAGSHINTLYEYDIAGDLWTQLTSGPGGRSSSVAIVYNGKIYIHGGFDSGTGLLDEIWEYDIIGDSWTQLTSGGSARINHTAIEYAGKMYIFGGNVGATTVTDPWQYDPISDTWQQLTDGSTLRSGHSAIEKLGKMYIFGGFDGANLKDIWSHDMGYAATGHITTNEFDLGSVPTNPGEWSISDVVPSGTSLTYEAWGSYSVNFSQWQEETTTGTKPAERFGHSVVVYGGKAYIFGGEDLSIYYNDVWELNLSTFTWTLKSPSGGPPTARTGHSAILDGSNMIIFAGKDLTNLNNEVWALNLSTFVWTQKTSGGTATAYHAAVNYSGKMYVSGGTSSASSDIPHKKTWEYNIAGDSWTAKTDSPLEVMSHSYVLSGDKMLTFGGGVISTGFAIKATYEYDIAGDSWSTKAERPSVDGVKGSAAVLYNGKVYIYGGYRRNFFSPETLEFWEYNISGDSWTQFADAAVSRFHPVGFLYGTEMITMGGVKGFTVYNDVYDVDLAGIVQNLGIIKDGDPIVDLYQYYRVKASFVSSTIRDKTPILSSIRADFAGYLKIDNSIGLTSLTTTIDLFEESTISQMTVTLALNKVTSDWMATKNPRNKRVRIFIGFRAEGFTDDDFEKFYFGTVANADITADNKVKIAVDGFAKDWKDDVPNVWEDAGDNVVWINEHPVDVMLDIYRQYLPVFDSTLLLSSFEEVRAQIPGWVITRTITTDPVEGKKLLEEIRKLISAFFIPQPDGKTKLKRWDPNEAAVITMTDTQLMSKNYKGNYKEITNKLYIYFDWAGTGDEAGDFNEVFADLRTDSKDNYGKFETKVLKDKWTPSAQLFQVEDRATKLLDRYENPPPLIPAVVDLKNLAVEEGDIINVTTKRAPSVDMAGISAVPFQLVKKQINWGNKTLSWELLAVKG